MKTKEELNALKSEVEALNQKLAELSEEELKLVAGGAGDIGKPVWGSDPQIVGETWWVVD